MTVTCSVCDVPCGDSGDVIKCAGTCGKVFHVKCVANKYPDDLVKTRDSRKKWYCEGCKKSKGQSSSSVNTGETGATTLTQEFMVSLLDAFKKEVFEELKSQSNQFQEFKSSLEFFSAKIDESNKVMDEIKKQYREINRENQEYKALNAQLTQKVTTLESKVRDLEQYSRRDNIEISGLPKTAGEDERSILRDVGRAIGLEVNENSVVAVHRVPTYNKTRAPPIVARFTTRDQRDAWIQAFKKMKTVLACDINNRFPATKIFIGEHLTPDNKQFLRKLKDACKELNIKYVWCREGKFYVRKSEGENGVRVNSVEDLQKIN